MLDLALLNAATVLTMYCLQQRRRMVSTGRMALACLSICQQAAEGSGVGRVCSRIDMVSQPTPPWL
jgi:hypothetical protein